MIENMKSTINITNQNQSISLWLTLSFESEVKREVIADLEIISCSCPRSFLHKIKIGYILKIVSVVYAKYR